MPDFYCDLDFAKMCTFRTNHLTYFAVVTTPTPPSTTTSHGGGSFRLSKDDCDGKDYSPSYYDRTCEGDVTTTDEEDDEVVEL